MASNDRGTAANDLVSLSEGGLIAQGLRTFIVIAGKGNDTLAVYSDSFSLPVGGGFFWFSGPGIDQITTLTNANLTLTNASLSSSEGGEISLVVGGGAEGPSWSAEQKKTR